MVIRTNYREVSMVICSTVFSWNNVMYIRSWFIPTTYHTWDIHSTYYLVLSSSRQFKYWHRFVFSELTFCWFTDRLWVSRSTWKSMFFVLYASFNEMLSLTFCSSDIGGLFALLNFAAHDNEQNLFWCFCQFFLTIFAFFHTVSYVIVLYYKYSWL